MDISSCLHNEKNEMILESNINSNLICSIEELKKINDIEEVCILYEKLEIQEKIIEDQLNSINLNRETLLDEYNNIFCDEVPNKLLPLLDDLKLLETSLNDTKEISSLLISPLIELDSIRNRLIETSKRTSNLIRLKNDILLAQNFLDSNEYIKATYLIAPYFSQSYNLNQSIDSKKDDKLFNNFQIDDSNSIEILEQIRDRIIREIDSKFNDTHDVELIALYAYLGYAERGLEILGRLFKNKLYEDLDAILKEINTMQKDSLDHQTSEYVLYPAAIAQLFRRLHRRLNKARIFLEPSFGPSGILRGLNIIKEDINNAILKLLNEFMISWASFIEKKSIGFLESQNSPKEISFILDQLVLVFQNIESHSFFIMSLIQQAKDLVHKLSHTPADQKFKHEKDASITSDCVKDSISSTEYAKNININEKKSEYLHSKRNPSEEDSRISSQDSKSLLNTSGPNSYSLSESNTFRCNFNAEMEVINQLGDAMITEIKEGPLKGFLLKLLDSYIKFEEFYLYKSIEIIQSEFYELKGISENSGNFAEDTIFILNESLTRAKSTYNYYALHATVKLVDSQLSGPIFSWIDNKIRANINIIGIALNNEKYFPEYALDSLNILEQINSGIFFFKDNIKASFETLLSKNPDYSQTTAEIFCQSLSVRAKIYSKSLKFYLKNLVLITRIPTIIVDSMKKTDYLLGEAQATVYQLNDPWVKDALSIVELILVSIKNRLSIKNLESFYLYLSESVAGKLENELLSMRYNFRGAELLDQNLGILISFFIQLSPKTKNFARLTQICSILTIERLDEIDEYLLTENGTLSVKKSSKIGIGEIKKILSLRVEFTKEEIINKFQPEKDERLIN